MAQSVYIKYNPYLLDTTIMYDNVPISHDSKLYHLRRERLQTWLDKLFPILAEELNDDEFDITFHGTDLDWEDLQEYAEEYRLSGFSIRLEHVPATSVSDKIQQLIQLFNEMQEGPFEDLKDKQIRENFEKALSSDFEVSVIATMSSGKSTIINAFLGRELMPSKHEACTATIVRIRDVDGKEVFTAVARDEEGRVIDGPAPIDLERMKQLNEDSNVAFIDIEGDIPFIHSKRVNLVLVDTPGPNNSRNEEHRNHTYRVIRNSAKPMVLYVLNATQLGTVDDSTLLGNVSEAMKIGGKQSKDRFIFAVNKIDEYDTERADSVEMALNNIREYLEQFGIERPNLYPMSAELAKVIRMHQNGQELTRKQRSTLIESELFAEEPSMHLTKYTPISERKKQALMQRAQEARQSGDIYSEALIHTGIPAVEEAINEYLDKYALTAKIKNAVDTFRKKIEEKAILEQLLENLRRNEAERERMHELMIRIERQLADGEEARKLRQRVLELKIDSVMESQIHDAILPKIEKLTASHLKNKEKMTETQVQQYLNKMIRKIESIRSEIVVQLEELVERDVLGAAEALLDEYRSMIARLLEEGALSIGIFETDSKSFFLGDLPDAEKLVNKHKYTVEEKVGEEYVENKRKRWYKPWTWFQSSGYYRDIMETRIYVNAEKLYDEFIKPVLGDFEELLNQGRELRSKNIEKMKRFFLGEMDKLDEVLRKKVAEMKQLTGSKKTLEDQIENDRAKMEWLYAFQQKLDRIMDI